MPSIFGNLWDSRRTFKTVGDPGLTPDDEPPRRTIWRRLVDAVRRIVGR
jgi:hypothetical protein